MTRTTFKKFIVEWAHTPKSIIIYLQKLGYKLLGKGVDQIAFLEPKTDQVLKIFGADVRARNQAHDMFAFWAKYCKDHSNNPFLPKFSGWSKFTYTDNKNYLQIRMEKLQKLPTPLAYSLESVAAELHQNSNPKSVKSEILNNLGEHDGEKPFDNNVDIRNFDELNKLAIMLGEKDFNLLLDTIADLSKIADDRGYEFDLHGQNFMHRNDGTPIIVDPWVV